MVNQPFLPDNFFDFVPHFRPYPFHHSEAFLADGFSFLISFFNFQLSTVDLLKQLPLRSPQPLAGRIGAAAIQGVPHV